MQLDRIIAVRNSKTVFCDEDRCIKVFNSGYSKTDILREALNLAYAEEAGLNVPKLLEVTTVNGKPALVSKYIEGKSVLRLMKEKPERKKGYLSLFVDAQLEIQKKSCSLPTSFKSSLSNRICSAGLSAPIRKELLLSLESLPEENALCHGDFYPSNVIIGNDGTPFIIDWSHAANGSPIADALQTFLLLFLRDGQKIAEYYLDLFCEKSNIKKENFDKWLPVVAAAQYAKSKEEERELLFPFIK